MFKNRRFDILQLEVTSKCALDCIMCPNPTLKNWRSREMSWKTYERISEYFDEARLIFLQGWGEPLQNARIFDMIKLAKRYDSEVGFTTNAMLLNRAVSKKIVNLGLDLISVSIAGAGKDVHESVRTGSNFERIMENVGILKNWKHKFASRKPRVVLSYIMTKRNIQDLPQVVPLAKQLGADRLVATNVDCVVNFSQDDLKVFNCQSANKEYLDIVEEAESKAKETKIEFRAFPLEIKPVPVCSENPLRNLYISAEGLVSPCVYLNLPLRSIPRIFCGKCYDIPRTYFGDITNQDLDTIWSKDSYKEFRRKFRARSTMSREGLLRVSSDLVLGDIEAAAGTYSKELQVNPLPDTCRTCYKAYGI